MNRFYGLAVARANLPRLTIAQRAVDKMVANALIYETETGESLVGLASKPFGRSEPDLYVLETIAPDDSAVRRGAYFEQGDDLQGDIFNWWYDNWQQFRERRRGTYGNAISAKWDAPLVHLGDWHKHPGTLVEPSWGDTDTARDHISDQAAGSPQVLAILATVWERDVADQYDPVDPTDLVGVNPQADDQPRPLKIVINAGTLVRLDCWYMSRQTRRFVRLKPTVAEDRLLPSLPIIGWHLVLRQEKMFGYRRRSLTRASLTPKRQLTVAF